MSTIGRLAASLFSGTQETTLALAQINFDFSLYKVEAPKEFQQLGAALSSRRRRSAEEGSLHITARKLEALFRLLLPPTPNLVQAYGMRVSEISQLPSINPKGTKVDGIFMDHIGVDGTSIWAAATSGEGAVAVHLLACMLARLWSPAEATSIWAQIIEERKRELRAVADPLHLSTLAAMEVAISSEQLAEWDASARAWLRSADKAMQKQQKQSMLILGNIDLPVNGKMDVYESVIHAWTTAMTMADALIAGKGQRVSDGAILLGIASWHLYPDLSVLGSSTHDIILKDKLVQQGGILTIGMQSAEADTQRGVTWSLPLSFLRYYGSSVLSTKHLGSHSSRISMSQLRLVALGCAIRDCRLSSLKLLEVARSIILLSKISSQYGSGRLPCWLSFLQDAAVDLCSASDSEQDSLQRLVYLGQRRCTSFLATKPVAQDDFFGICNTVRFLGLLKGPEAQVEALRDLACRLNLKPGCCIIRFKDARGYEYFATAIPCSLDLNHQDQQQTEACSSVPKQHYRWYERSTVKFHNLRKIKYNSTNEQMLPIENGFISADNHALVWHDPPKAFLSMKRSEVKISIREYVKGKSTRAQQDPFLYLSKICGELSDSGGATLYAVRPKVCAYITYPSEDFSASDIVHNLEKNRFDIKLLHDYFETPYFKGPIFKSLNMLFGSTRICEPFGGAMVSLDITSNPFHLVKWAQNLESITDSHWALPNISRGTAFACIASFESGSPHFSPEGLENVMALSTGDSIYVAAALLHDPLEKTEPWMISRINGNIGKPGIAMMIPPQFPLVKEVKKDTWDLVNHAEFDGALQNSFEATSLHLSFSEYTLPIDLGLHGGRYREAFFLETLVSIYDRGEWIADLDILGALESKDFSRIERRQIDCLHSDKSKHKKQQRRAMLNSRLTSIDSWTEFLDRPQHVGIVRSHKNWLGRLAAAVLSVQQGYDTRVLPDELCWNCFIERGGLVQRKISKEICNATPNDSEDDEYWDSETETEECVVQESFPMLIC